MDHTQIPEWVATSSSRRSSQPRDRTCGASSVILHCKMDSSPPGPPGKPRLCNNCWFYVISFNRYENTLTFAFFFYDCNFFLIPQGFQCSPTMSHVSALYSLPEKAFWTGQAPSQVKNRQINRPLGMRICSRPGWSFLLLPAREAGGCSFSRLQNVGLTSASYSATETTVFTEIQPFCWNKCCLDCGKPLVNFQIHAEVISDDFFQLSHWFYGEGKLCWSLISHFHHCQFDCFHW